MIHLDSSDYYLDTHQSSELMVSDRFEIIPFHSSLNPLLYFYTDFGLDSILRTSL